MLFFFLQLSLDTSLGAEVSCQSSPVSDTITTKHIPASTKYHFSFNSVTKWSINCCLVFFVVVVVVVVFLLLFFYTSLPTELYL